jgi:hypothetical protein
MQELEEGVVVVVAAAAVEGRFLVVLFLRLSA